jgi:predicted dehydrogenase
MGEEMPNVPLAIVGCGGMGGRHLLGLGELYASAMCNVELVAVCDLRRDNAEHLADDAEALLGRRPLVFDDMERMVAAVPDLEAVDITTDAGSHHIVACAALDLGLHVLCEKPLALTMRGCNMILDAQRRSGKTLSVAENFRRDPMPRLTRALLDAGAIGTPYLFWDINASAGNRMVITPWRHKKHMGGILLDIGVHNADLMMYYLGDVRHVYAQMNLWEPTRFKSRGSGVSGFYERWYGELPETIEATAEDALVSAIAFERGTMGQWTHFFAAHGERFGHRVIYGSAGSLRPGGTRNGRSPVVTLDDGTAITGEALLDLVPDFSLDPLPAQLFGGERLGAYDLPFPQADRKLLAIEYHEIGQCATGNASPEVDGLLGRRDVALCYAAFESSVLNRPVTLDEVESEQAASYESEINAHWGI